MWWFDGPGWNRQIKSAKFIFYAMCNDVMHEVALLVPAGAPLRDLYM